MRFRALLPIALLLLLPMILRAQSYGVLAGKVTDLGGNPFAGAVIEVLKTSPKLGSYARFDGSYRVLRLRPGTYKVLAQIPPYRLRDTFTVTIRAGATDTLDIKVDPRKAGTPRGEGNADTERLTAYGGDGTSIGSMATGFESDYAVAADESPASIPLGKAPRGSSVAPLAPPPPPPAPVMTTMTAEEVRSSARRDVGGLALSTETTARGRTMVGGAKAKAATRSSDGYKYSPKKGEAKEMATSTSEAPRETEISDDRARQSQQQAPGQLTAGEWSDLDNWPFWLDVVADPAWERMLTRWGCNPASRVTVRLVDGIRPVVDAEVRLVDGQGQILWTARSDNRGRAELFAGMRGAKGEYRVQVKNGSAFIDAGTATSGAPSPLVVKLPGAAVRRDEFDLMFVVDATGSMGDEMSYIKAELESVINRNREATNEELKLRLSCNFYRDQGDEYLVRPFEFDESTFEMIGHLRDQVADGGGDTPEAVEDALEDAIEKHAWSPSARARLMFLVLDAPPHYTPERCEKIRALAARAAAKGIRIIPIASSGIDKETEFLLRLLGIYTGGTYTFLTDDSGIGGSHIKPTVGSYKVEFLNDLMVRVIARYLGMEELSADGGSGIELR